MYLEIPVAPSKSVVVGRYEVGNSSGSFQKVCSPQTWLCIFAGLSEVRCMCLGEFCRTTLWESPCTREYIHMSILPSLLPFLLNINVSPSLAFFQNSLTLCTRLQSVPPKGVGTNRCLQLLFQNTSSIISCLFLSGSRISPQPYLCLPSGTETLQKSNYVRCCLCLFSINTSPNQDQGLCDTYCLWRTGRSVHTVAAQHTCHRVSILAATCQQRRSSGVSHEKQCRPDGEPHRRVDRPHHDLQCLVRRRTCEEEARSVSAE